MTLRKYTSWCAITLMTIFGFTACITFPTHARIEVSSLRAQSAAGKDTYWLLPGNKGVSAGDLQFQEYAAQVERALSSRGFQRSENLKSADVVIFLSYGIGNPQEHAYSFAIPQYGQTGIASSTTYGTINSYGNRSTFSGNTYYTPRYGVTGYTNVQGTFVTYFRFISLDAYDLQAFEKSKKSVELWRTEIGSTGRTGDLRVVFPVLVAASAPYIATDTGRIVTVTIGLHDPSITKITGTDSAGKP